MAPKSNGFLSVGRVVQIDLYSRTPSAIVSNMRHTKRESSTETLACVKAEMNLPRITKSARNQESGLSAKGAEALLETHRQHLGLYQRLAERLGVDASYVSKVASGTRKCESVRRTLLKELIAFQQ